MQNTPPIRTWLKDQLETKGWTRADLARATGTAESTWHHIFNGKTGSIRKTNITKLCDIFGVSEEHILEIAMGHVTQREGEVCETVKTYKTKWDRLADWTATQPEPIKKALVAVAESHGWNG